MVTVPTTPNNCFVAKESKERDLYCFPLRKTARTIQLKHIRVLLKLLRDSTIVGVLVDCATREVSFYDADTGSLLDSTQDVSSLSSTAPWKIYSSLLLAIPYAGHPNSTPFLVSTSLATASPSLLRPLLKFNFLCVCVCACWFSLFLYLVTETYAEQFIELLLLLLIFSDMFTNQNEKHNLFKIKMVDFKTNLCTVKCNIICNRMHWFLLFQGNFMNIFSVMAALFLSVFRFFRTDSIIFFFYVFIYVTITK